MCLSQEETNLKKKKQANIKATASINVSTFLIRHRATIVLLSQWTYILLRHVHSKSGYCLGNLSLQPSQKQASLHNLFQKNRNPGFRQRHRPWGTHHRWFFHAVLGPRCTGVLNALWHSSHVPAFTVPPETVKASRPHCNKKLAKLEGIQLEKLPRQPGSSAEGTKIQDLHIASQAGVFIQQSGSRKRVLWGWPCCFLWAEDFACFPASWPWTLTFHFWICN